MPDARHSPLWAITAYFDPAASVRRLGNFRRFASRLRAQGVPLLVVELAAHGQDYRIDGALADRVLRLRSDARLWHKERMLNLGLSELPASCEAVAWLDADVLFTRDDWPEQAMAALTDFPVVQPFHVAMQLHADQAEGPSSPLPWGTHEGQFIGGMGFLMSKAEDRKVALADYLSHGHSGYAWVAHRELLERHGFYDRQIVGGGDLIMAHAFYGAVADWRNSFWDRDRLSPALLADIRAWADGMYADVRGNVGFTWSKLLHLWHGDHADRRYAERLDGLRRNDFDPAEDLVLDDSGCWAWRGNKPALETWVADYLGGRADDG